jgi:hypothetical protein
MEVHTALSSCTQWPSADAQVMLNSFSWGATSNKTPWRMYSIFESFEAKIVSTYQNGVTEFSPPASPPTTPQAAKIFCRKAVNF